ncbi:hypothetical protein [Myroides odoratimimus]|nr:hypothetical protein [Myroides odoratimimus]
MGVFTARMGDWLTVYCYQFTVHSFSDVDKLELGILRCLFILADL